ncbi:glycosyltransferase family 2 protein [Acidobacteriota bacterium]
MISVLIPSYNRSFFLKEAIQSVLNQDYFKNHSFSDSCELIVIDDGSTDNTRDVVKSFGSSVKYHYENHKGVSAVRNIGLEVSTGDYVAYLDSDDLWKKDKLSVQMNFMEAFPDAMVCYTEETWIRRGVFVNPKKKHRKYSRWIFDKVLPLCLLSLSSALFRKGVFEVIGNFDESLPACEDYDLGIRLAHKYPVHLIPKPLIIKRGGHPDQLSQSFWGMDRFRVNALQKALLLDLTPHQEALVKQEITKKCLILANGFKKRQKEHEARKYLELLDKYKLKEES